MEPMKQKTDDAREGITDRVIFWKELGKTESRDEDSHWAGPLLPLKQKERQISTKIIWGDEYRSWWISSWMVSINLINWDSKTKATRKEVGARGSGEKGLK